MDLTAEVREEGAEFWARVVELPGCFASGDTLDELREALGEAIGLYVWDRPARLADERLEVGTSQIEVQAPAQGSSR